jgi:hypothetical protein
MNAPADDASKPALFPSEPVRPSTSIAAQLQEHFARGGTAAEAVRLVEWLEHCAQTDASRSHGRDQSASRGTRLPADWQPSERCITYALDRGMSHERVSIEIEKFLNYWTAKSGARATKRDWNATWRNWIINAMERGYGPPSYRGHSPGTDLPPRRAATGSDAVLAGMGRLARRIDKRRSSAGAGGQEISQDSNPAGELNLEPGRAR